MDMNCPCKNILSGKQEKYCSISCSRYYSTRFRREEKIANKTIKCVGCGVEKIGIKHIRKYCSIKCRNSYRGKEYYIKNRETEKQRKLDGYYKRYFSGNADAVYKKYKNICANCWSENNLAIHHIDLSGTSKKPNNSIENLVLLCNSCHGKIHYFLQAGKVDEDIVRTYVKT